MTTEEQIKAIEKQLSELKASLSKPTQFEVEKWYMHDHSIKCLFNYQPNGKGFGFNNGDWTLNWCCDPSDWHKEVRPATESEIKEALVTEAIKRGFKEGVRIEIIKGYSKGNVSKNKIKSEFYYELYEDELSCESYGCDYTIYSKGKWATIVKDEPIKIGGYEVSFSGDYTMIDGNIFTKEFWQAAKVVASHNKAGVRVGCSKQFDVSLETINKIINQIK